RLVRQLSSERKARLDALGFDWDPIATQWEEGFENLRTYVSEHGDSRVPQSYKSTDNYRLGTWVHAQRQNRNSLSPEQKARLDALAFVWDPLTTQWEESFEQLQTYVTEHKHCRVPAGYKSLDGFSLGAWVSNQRHSRHKLSSERKARLDALGFDWDRF